MKISRLAALAVAALTLHAGAAFSQTQPIPGAKTAAGTPAPVTGAALVVAPAGGGAGLGIVVATDNPLPVTCLSGCSGGGGGGSTTVTAKAVAPTYVEGSTTNPLSTDLRAGLRTVQITPAGASFDPSAPYKLVGTDGSTIASGANPVPISGPVTATVSGVATAANQTAVTGSKSGGTAAASALLTGGVFNTVLPTLTDGQQGAIQLDSSGRAIITCPDGSCGGGGGGSLSATASSTPTPVLAGPNKPLNIGLFSNLFVTPATPSGALVDLSTPSALIGADGTTIASGANPLPVSGTVTANLGTIAGVSTAANQASVIGTKAAGTAATNSLLTGGVYNTSLPTLTNGQQAAAQLDSVGRLIVNCGTGCSGGGGGTVAIDQTTPGTTNGVQVNASALPTGASTAANQSTANASLSAIDTKLGGTLTVGLPSGAATAAKQPAFGTAGTPSTDVLSVQGISGGTNLPVSQATAANLNAAVVGNVASGATDSGNPVKIGGIFNTTLPTLTNGQRGDIQQDANGNTRSRLVGSSSAGVDAYTNSALAWVMANSATSGGTTVLPLATTGAAYNGSTWDRLRGNTVGLAVLPNGMSAQRWSYAAASGGISNTTTAVTIKAAAGAGLKNCVASLQLSADALGTATEFAIRDGAGGTVLWRTKIQTAGLTSSSPPLSAAICGTANTLLEVVTLTASGTGAVYFNAQGSIEP